MVKAAFTLHGSDALMKTLGRAYKQAPDATQKVIQNSAEKGSDIAKRRINAHGAVDSEFMRDHVVAKHPKPLESVIHSEASYSGYVNYGTRFMGSRPFFYEMWRETLPLFYKDMEDVAKGLLR